METTIEGMTLPSIMLCGPWRLLVRYVAAVQPATDRLQAMKTPYSTIFNLSLSARRSLAGLSSA